MRTASLALLAVIGVVGIATAQDSPDGPKIKAPTRLFSSVEPITIKLVADLKQTFRDRDTTKQEWTPAQLSWTGDDSGTTAVEITTRGHFRLKSGTCTFPGLRVRFQKDSIKGTIWQGQGSIKLGAHCRSGNERYHQIPLQEILAYRTYNLLTDSSFRVRPVKATYVDTGDQNKTVEAPAFFLEDEPDLGGRMGLKELEQIGATFNDVDQPMLAIMSVFLYMIGNTDWSLPFLHNIRLFQGDMAYYLAVPYDFDWSGIVDAPYAKPDYRLNIRSVRDRLWRGPCFSQEQLGTALALFKAKKDDIYKLYQGMDGLDPKLLKNSIDYLDEFYKLIDDARAVDREMRKPCTT
ncbi:MAG: hypothetical protein H6R40_77 [Gemmatimonadetes bacterium]|nr:hypothetical protein [Gemmatimonadota bacterium]